MDVVVFVPVAFNQFLTRPLFCVGMSLFYIKRLLFLTDRYFLSSEFSKHVGCHVMLTLPQGVNYGKFTGMRLTNILKYALTDSQPKLLE